MTIAPRSESAARGRSGFTLVELLVAVLIGSVLMGSIYQVLVTNQRVSTVQNEQVLAQQTVRAGLDLLAQELREVSAGGGDLLVAEAGRVEFRALRNFGITCLVNPPNVRVATVIRPFEGRPDIYIFADGNPQTAADDAWYQATLQELPQSETCPGSGLAAQRLILQGLTSAQFNAIRVGAPVRSFETVAYHLDSMGGQTYLVRTSGDETARLVGPLEAGSGLRFAYLDQAGQPTANPANVRRVQITIRTLSQARHEGGSALADSLTTTVHLRN